MKIPAISDNSGTYHCIVPFGALKSILAVSADYQRALNQKRAEGFFEYVYWRLKNGQAYTIPNLIGCYLSEDAHLLEFDGSALCFPEIYRFSCVDGQHRIEGIRILLENCPEKASLTVGLTLFEAKDARERRQMFSDINATPKPVSRAQALEFDHVTPSVQIAKKLRDAVPIFSLPLEKTKERRSTPGMGAVISLNGIHQIVEQSLESLYAVPISRVDDPAEYMIAYWASISQLLYPWKLLLSLSRDKLETKKVREFKRTTFAFSAATVQSLTALFCYCAKAIHAKRIQWYRENRTERLTLLTRTFTDMLAPMSDVDFCLDPDNGYLDKGILAIKKVGDAEAVIVASPRSTVLQLLSADFTSRI